MQLTPVFEIKEVFEIEEEQIDRIPRQIFRFSKKFPLYVCIENSCWTYFDPFSAFCASESYWVGAKISFDWLTYSAQKSDANFAGAKLKNFVAKREGRIAIFIEKTWLKSQFS